MGAIRHGLPRVICGSIWYLVSLTILAAVPDANASAWSREDGDLMIISSADYFTSDLGKVNIGGVDVDGRFERIQSNTYVEYGLTNKLTIGGKVFYGTSWLTRGADVQSTNGFTEFETFIQHQLLRNARDAVAVKLTGGVPTGSTSGTRPSEKSDGGDLEISALYGRSITFQPIKTFAAGEVGYRKRFGDSADQLRFLATLGASPNDRWTFLLDLFSVLSLRNERLNGADFDVVKIQPAIVWRATRRFSFQAGVTKEIAGRNLALGMTYFVGMRTQF